MPFIQALKKIGPCFALTLLIAFAAQATPNVNPTPAPQPPAGTQPAGTMFAIAPASPTVYYANYSAEGTPIQAPWFRFTPSMINNTGRIITVMEMAIELVSSANGTTTSQVFYIQPNAWGGIFQSRPGKPIASEDYYVEAIANAGTSVYQVTLHMTGWYGTASAPQDRFSLDYSFRTK